MPFNTEDITRKNYVESNKRDSGTTVDIMQDTILVN
jgi:hypothetical protein